VLPERFGQLQYPRSVATSCRRLQQPSQETGLCDLVCHPIPLDLI
jgi:hypothetical protein